MASFWNAPLDLTTTYTLYVDLDHIRCPPGEETHSDPLIEWFEDDPMNVRVFLEYDAQMPLWSRVIYTTRTIEGI